MARPAECQTRASSERSVATSHCSFFCCIAMLGLGGCSLLGGLGRSPSRSCRSASSPRSPTRSRRSAACRSASTAASRARRALVWAGRRVTWLRRAAARAARSARPPAGDVPRPFPRLLTPASDHAATAAPGEDRDASSGASWLRPGPFAAPGSSIGVGAGEPSSSGCGLGLRCCSPISRSGVQTGRRSRERDASASAMAADRAPRSVLPGADGGAGAGSVRARPERHRW